MEQKQKGDSLRKEFLEAEKKHILMITNHGIHQWDVITSLPDTGGQNVYVNQLTDVLKDFGYKITIVNRGGYQHPQTGETRTGFRYKNAYERIFYVEDSTRDFVRKEDMKEQIPELVESLYGMLESERQQVDVIMSHYWDAALLGVKLNEKLPSPVPHLWVPHSLGAVKKRNMPPETWEKLRVDERIATEQEFISRLDYVAATSSLIRDSLREDYGREMSLFLPP
ncbi:MAG: glycosyltransferase, partial [Sediminispirochaetaceae bacterium]